jgi:flagellar basal body-associated protein FliL
MAIVKEERTFMKEKRKFNFILLAALIVVIIIGALFYFKVF